VTPASATILVMAKIAIAHQAEGMSVPRLEQKSAAKTGRSMDEWRRAVLEKLQSGDKSLRSAAKFLEGRNWTGADPKKAQNTGAFAELIGQQGYSTSKNGLPSSLGMMTKLGKDLIYDTGWQPVTSVSYVTRYTAADAKAKTIPAGKKPGDVKTKVYVDPEEEPGVVARDGVDAGLGSFVRLGEAENPLRYARVIDAKPGGSEAAEINIAAGQNLGNLAFDPNISRGTTTVDVVGANPRNRPGGVELPLDTRLGNEQTQHAGYLADVKKEPYANVSTKTALTETMKKYDKDPAFTKYKADVKDALAKQKRALEKSRQDAIDAHLKAGGGDRVEKGVPTVFGGKAQRQIVTVTSPTQSGDALKEGRWGTYAGLDRQPVSTLGSTTLQGQSVVTALDDVFVFGRPTERRG